MARDLVQENRECVRPNFMGKKLAPFVSKNEWVNHYFDELCELYDIFCTEINSTLIQGYIKKDSITTFHAFCDMIYNSSSLELN